MHEKTVTAIVVTPIQLLNAYELFVHKYSEFNFQAIIDKESAISSQKQIRSVADELSIKIIDPIKSPKIISKFRFLESVNIVFQYYMMARTSDVIIVGNWTNTRASLLITIMSKRDCWFVDDGLNTLMYPNLPTRKDLSDEVPFGSLILHNMKKFFAKLLLPKKNTRFFSIYPRADKNFFENSYQCLCRSLDIKFFNKENRVIFLGGPYVSTKTISGILYHNLLSSFVAWARLEFPKCSIEYHAHRRETIEVKYADELFDLIVTDTKGPIELRLLKQKVKVQAIFSNESSAVFTCKKIGLSEYGGIISVTNNPLYITSTPYMKLFWNCLDEMIEATEGVSKVTLLK